MDGLDEIDSLRHPMKLRAGDVLLLCSDGVGGVLSEDQLIECLSAPVPEEMCRRMHEMVIAAGRRYQDNYTALVVRCEY